MKLVILHANPVVIPEIIQVALNRLSRLYTCLLTCVAIAVKEKEVMNLRERNGGVGGRKGREK